ncbi:hypothetical protein GPUN_1218 [Glaciecola punicea ACAM 611]|uniref:Proteophosphoglycan n=1 Tax=Glaciecola punicea ACAM 611 TaxID=1121923 RepID=H5TAL5_9ALTE|nr:DUF1285 domain-containing protein [Glaciecola punicea]GAB55342.1 hypothetical protein GPUN_1218 [Glaciecola punicea ACAM 611]
MDIAQLQKQISTAGSGAQSMPPVDKWDPPFCGDMNLVIKRSGQWWHEGTPFTRAKLIALLASVVKKEGEKYFLVTPGEKIGITVEDVPFVIIDASLDEASGLIQVDTLTGDSVRISKEHPVEIREFEGNLVPYCHIRRNLWARVHQNVLYRWVDQAKQVKQNNTTALHLSSGDYSFAIGTFKE